MTDQTNGVYLNDIEVPGPRVSGNLLGEFSLTREVGDLLRPGTNTLYLYVWDRGAVAGILFSAEITLFPLPPAPASFMPFGSGCEGSGGIPSLSPKEASLPYVGETFDLRLDNLPASILNVPFGLLGTSDQHWSGMPLPFDLSPLGMTGCSVLIDLLRVFQLGNASGTAAWAIDVPLDPSLIGGRFFCQAFITDFDANLFGATMTNAGEIVIGLR